MGLCVGTFLSNVEECDFMAVCPVVAQLVGGDCLGHCFQSSESERQVYAMDCYQLIDTYLYTSLLGPFSSLGSKEYPQF